MDPVRGKTALEWAFLTDSFGHGAEDPAAAAAAPSVEQLSRIISLSGPALPGLVAQAQPPGPPGATAHLDLPFVQSPQEGGVLDHLVTITTSLASPFSPPSATPPALNNPLHWEPEGVCTRAVRHCPASL